MDSKMILDWASALSPLIAALILAGATVYAVRRNWKYKEAVERIDQFARELERYAAIEDFYTALVVPDPKWGTTQVAVKRNVRKEIKRAKNYTTNALSATKAREIAETWNRHQRLRETA